MTKIPDAFKTHPAVFAVGNNYQIMVPVKYSVIMWVKVGTQCYYDDSNGILRSEVTTHRVTVPMDELDREKKYTICYRKIIDRKPYYPELENEVQTEYDFYPVGDKETVVAYHISDAHNAVEHPVKAAKTFENMGKNIDFLILNGDIPNHSGKIEYFDNIYQIVSDITHGSKPALFSRGNHDTRGIYSENISDHTPTEQGNSFFSFRLGSLWGLVIDCGEDKVDEAPPYGGTICCHAFRERETKYIKSLITRAHKEFLAEGVKHRVVVCHVPFTEHFEEDIFNIEEDIYRYWAQLLKEFIRPDVMLCGHTHRAEIHEPGCEHDVYGQPCTIVIGSKPSETGGECYHFVGAGIEFRKDEIEVFFTDSDGNHVGGGVIKK